MSAAEVYQYKGGDVVLCENTADFEESIERMYHEAYKNNAQQPKHLVLSERPYRTLELLCAQKLVPFYDMDGEPTYHGMKIIRLKHWDKDIAEVG